MGWMVRYLVLFSLVLLIHASIASAHHSGEELWLNVKAADPATRTFTITCEVPPSGGTATSYYWTVRPDTPEIEYSIQKSTGELTYTMSKNVLYHIGCQANNGTQTLRGDFHLDFRTAPNTDKPNVRALSTDGLSVTLQCTPPPGVTNYNLYWSMLGIKGQISYPEYNNQNTVTITVPYALIWDADCGIWDKDRQQWTQWGLPIEFFKYGQPYLADTVGCVPNHPCYTNTTTPPPTNNTNNSACYSSVQSIPASCTGGTVTQDSYDGCRHITCTNGGNNLQVLACDKGSYFELYKQNQLGTTVKEICIGSTCVGNSGYAKSSTFPICSGSTTPPPPPPPTNNTNNSACYSSVQQAPVTCTSTIMQDTWNGCRTVICGTSSSNIKVLACDKSGFFEVYRQSATGTIPKVCFGSTCIQTEGYAKSNTFPICTGTTTPPPPTSTCYTAQNAPASCSAGSITQDSYDGCRHITCTNGGNNLQVLACDKSGYFEMYKQSSSGTIEACLGSTCLASNSGYARSICTANHVNPDAPTWLEPNRDDVNPYDFHIQVNAMQDADGDAHTATDFELWEGDGSERVWSSLHNSAIKLHIHKGDGSFEGNLASSDHLKYDHAYKVRSRFYDGAGGVSAWSEWRAFRTMISAPEGTSTAWTVAPGYHVELVSSDISMPVNIAMAPNKYTALPQGQQPLLYVTQLYGQIGMIRRDGTYVKYADDLLNYDIFGSLPGSGEMGVTGLYVDPSGDLFVSYVYVEGNETFGRVERFYTNANGDGYTGRRTILNRIIVSPSHQVQQITRGPDGKLYLNTGDADLVGTVQDPNYTNGKVLRFNDDGSIPSDNPWPGTYVYAVGFRNHFGADWRPGTNELWVSHNGPDANDGMFKVTRGYVGSWKPGGDTRAGTWHLWPQTTAPTAVAFSRGTSGFDTNAVYVALSGATYTPGPDTTGKRIVKLAINGDGSDGGQSDLVQYTGTGYSAPIGAAFGSDGLYFTDLYGEQGFVGVGVTKGAIYKVAPGAASNATNNTQTVLSASIAPARWYPQGRNVVWECKSSGGSGNFHYDYNFGDGNQQFDTTATNVYHTYAAAGTYTARCTVHDLTTGGAASGQTTIQLS
jgi:hypothetical protein